MQEKLALGVVRPVEQAVLQAIDLSGCLVGASKVEVADKLGSFKATFDVNGSDMLSKQVETLKVAYDWLLQMSHSSKQGILTQSLKKVEQVAKPAAALEKAADDLSSGKTMEEVVSSLGSTELLKGAQDVTAVFMKPDKVEQEELPLSKISVHKGSLNTFINIAFSNHEAWALLLGKVAWNGKYHVTNFVLSTGSVQELLEHTRVKARCDAQGLGPCGVVMVGRPEQFEDHILRLFSSTTECPLFINVDFSKATAGTVLAWELADDESSTKVRVQWATQPRELQKRLLYNICWIHDLGTSQTEHATKRICAAVLSQVLEKGDSEGKDRQFLDTTWYRRVEVPQDGMCGWHCLVGARSVKKFESIPRQTGVPVNQIVAKEESKVVREFWQATCEKAIDKHGPDDFLYCAIQRVQSQKQFGPADLQWISEALDLTVRVTCSLQAGCSKSVNGACLNIQECRNQTCSKVLRCSKCWSQYAHPAG